MIKTVNLLHGIPSWSAMFPSNTEKVFIIKCGWVDIQPLSGHLTQNLLNTWDTVKFHTETEWKHQLQHNRVPDST